MTPVRQWSQHQNMIFDFVANGRGSALVLAVAGAGKTTTIVEAVKRIHPRNSIHMLAFNSAIARELKERVPSHVRASTFHSVGNGALIKKIGFMPEIDAKKMRRVLAEKLSDHEFQLFGEFVTKLVSFGKGEGIGVLKKDHTDSWLHLVAHHDMSLDIEAPGMRADEDLDDYADRVAAFEREMLLRATDLASRALEWSNEAAEKGLIDFDDQLYLPLLWDLPLWKNDFVFVDENQDLNPVRRALVRKMLKPKWGRVIGVGDPKQSIYGFTGASVDAMALMGRDFNCIELPLTVSYRCAQAIVQKAQEIVDYIQASPSAPVGEVIYDKKLDRPFDTTTLGPRDAILCRNTAPLVSHAFKLIARRIPCKVLGREIGQGLIALVKKMKAESLLDLETKLTQFQMRETERFRKKGEERKIEEVNDKVQCLIQIMETLSEDQLTVAGVIKSIEDLFTDDASDILTLSTVHKAKGREWDTVVILAPELMPSKWARMDWQREQELNLMYVAYTRAKLRLVILDR